MSLVPCHSWHPTLATQTQLYHSQNPAAGQRKFEGSRPKRAHGSVVSMCNLCLGGRRPGMKFLLLGLVLCFSKWPFNLKNMSRGRTHGTVLKDGGPDTGEQEPGSPGLLLAKSQKLLGRSWNRAGKAELRKVQPGWGVFNGTAQRDCSKINWRHEEYFYSCLWVKI